MHRLFVLPAVTGVLLLPALVSSSSQAAMTDSVQLRVEAPSIDGALVFTYPSGLTWRCASPVCIAHTERGSSLTVKAVSGSASAFQWWGGACSASGTQSTCTVRVDASEVDVTARFSRVRLWLPTFGNGAITVSSPTPGGTPPAGYSCGSGCIDYSTGQQLVLRAAPLGGYRMIAWGGVCTTVAPSHGCLVTMSRNKLVSATFEPIDPLADCPPDYRCGQTSEAKWFRVTVTGAGSIDAGRQGSNSGIHCEASATVPHTCWLRRILYRTVDLSANGVHFLGWGGRCSGGGSTCTFTNKNYSRQTAVIMAKFGQ